MARRSLSGTFPVLAGDKDRLLGQALEELSTSPAPLGAIADPIVTAARRLPAVVASFAPYPEGTDERLRAALAAYARDASVRHAGMRVDLVAVSPASESGIWQLDRLPGIDAW